MKIDYWQLQGLAGVFLEDSYVLSISETQGTFTFALDAVLTTDNPRYVPPAPDEQYCYALGNLIFGAVTAVTWRTRSTQQYTDATGAHDLGNIDTLSFDDGLYVAEGDWGHVEIHSSVDPVFLYD